MKDPTCPLHGHPDLRREGQNCTCLHVTWTLSGGTIANDLPRTNWEEQLQKMREWSAHVEGQLEPGAFEFLASHISDNWLHPLINDSATLERIQGHFTGREVVPDTFQKAFSEGELEL